MNVKLADVAREAGVGYGTASRAIAGRGAVDKETRQRVLDAATRLGYRTHAAARALREQRTRTVGLIVPDIVNQFYTESAEVLQAILDDAGYQLVVATTGNSVERERRAVDSMLDRQVDAVVHVPISREVSFPAGLPVVELNRQGSMGRPAVLSDDVAGMRDLAGHLLERGYRDIAAVVGPEGLSTSEDRRRGLGDALRASGVGSGAGAGSGRLRILSRDYSPAGGAAAFEELLEDLPEVLVPLSSQLMLGVIRAARKRGVDIPGDLAVATYGGAEWLDIWGPGITTFEPSLQTMGARAARLTLELLQGEPPVDATVLVPGSLVVRGTTPVLSRSAGR